MTDVTFQPAPGALTRRARSAVLALFSAGALVSLAACAGVTPGGLPGGLARADLTARHGRPVYGEAATGRTTEIAYLADETGGDAPPAGVQQQADGYSVNFRDVDLETAAASLLGDVLGLTYSIAPDAGGTLTLVTAASVSREDLLAAFDAALETAGLELAETGGAYVVRPTGQRSAFVGVQKDGYGITAYPLAHVSGDKLKGLVEGFALPAENIRVADRLLLIKGTAAERRTAAGLVATLDSGALAKKEVAVVRLAHASPAELEDQMSRVTAEGALPADFSLIALDSAGAVLVLAPTRSALKTATAWVTRLDTLSTGANVQVYRVRYGRAQQIAGMLSQAFGAAPVAPADKAPAGKEQTGDIVATSFETLMAPQEGAARFIANDSDNSIVISASPTQYREALRLLAALDKPPVQVLIDVTLVEVNLNESTKFGVEAYLQGFGGKLSLGGGATPANAGAASGFNLVFGEQDSPKFVIDALSRVTDVRVISAPSVVAFESEEAEIKVVEQVPIITQQVVRTEAGNAPVVNSIEYRDAGVILRVTPSTADSDLVNLNVQQELSAVVGETENGATLTPTLRQRSISTRVSVYDGQTVVLGGLIAAQSAKDRKGLPIFDFLDTSRLDGQARTELIVFITPHVVRDARDAESVSRELRSRMAALGE